MAPHETRDISTYLRDGSLWVGRFVVDDGELNFGDDRFDAAHGLAKVVCAELVIATNEASAQMHTMNRSSDQTVAGKTASVPKFNGLLGQFKRAA